MTDDPIIIASYARTPMGGFQGALSGVTATELGATAVKAAVERADHEEHVQMLLLERTLAREAPVMGQNARARAIAERLLHQRLAREHPALSAEARTELVRRRVDRKYQQVRRYLRRNVWSKKSG